MDENQLSTSHKGVFIVLEGADGSGKTTQFKLLEGRLSAVGYEVAVFDFPRYEEPSSHFVRQYLNGHYGPAANINPYAASMFYALDRYEAAPEIRQAISDGKVVLANRYVGSNMAHQGSKFTSEAQQRGFFVWGDSLEYQLLGIPRPDINIYLRVPAEVSYRLVARKNARRYTEQTRDEHEKDINHLTASVAAYDRMTQLFPKDFVAIDCTDAGRLRTIPSINDSIWTIIRPLLHSELTRRQPRAKTIKVKDPAKQAVQLLAGRQGHKADSPKSNLFHLEAISLKAVAELQTINGLEIRLPKSFFKKTGLPIFRPPGLPAAEWTYFQESIMQINKWRSEIAKLANGGNLPSQVAEWLLKLSLPVSMQAETVLAVEPNKAGQISARLRQTDQVELQLIANQLDGSKKAAKTGVQPILETELEGPLPSGHEVAELVDFWPRNEFDLISTFAYGRADGQDSRELASSFSHWDWEKKQTALIGLFNDSSRYDSLPRLPHYEFEILASAPVVEHLKTHNMIQVINSQPPHPRHGYDIPQTTGQLKVDDLLEQCFDSSLALYSRLQASAGNRLASYGLLLGHRALYQISLDHRQLRQLQQSAGASSMPGEIIALAETIVSKASEVHPTAVSDRLAKPISGRIVSRRRRRSSKTPSNP